MRNKINVKNKFYSTEVSVNPDFSLKETGTQARIPVDKIQDDHSETGGRFLISPPEGYIEQYNIKRMLGISRKSFYSLLRESGLIDEKWYILVNNKRHYKFSDILEAIKKGSLIESSPPNKVNRTATVDERLTSLSKK